MQWIKTEREREREEGHKATIQVPFVTPRYPKLNNNNNKK